MTTLLVLQGAGFVLLLLASGFFSSSETALFSLSRQQVNRIAEDDPELAERLRGLLEQPTRLLSTILIGNTIVNVNLWIVGAMLLNGLGLRHEWGQVGVLTLLTLIFGEFGPKRLSLILNGRLAARVAAPLAGFVRLLRWPRAMLEVLTDRFSHFFLPSGHILSQAEYDTLMKASGETGDLDDHEYKMVQGILSLEQQTVADVMTPRVDLEGVDPSDPEEDLRARAKACKVRHLVLFDEQLDNITGLLDVRRYLLDPTGSVERSILRPFYVPEQCTLDKLLPQMLAAGQRVAIVVDEYGGTAGLITRGDILEELTGEMDDEDHPQLVCERLTSTAWLLDGQMHLLDVERETGLRLESETADRLAGWFMEEAEHLPSPNERIEGPGYKAMVREMRRNRILLILLEVVPETEEGG